MTNNIFKNGKKEFGFLDAGIAEFVYLVMQYLVIAVFYMAISLGLPSGGAVSEIASFAIELCFVGTVLVVALSTKTNVFKATTIKTKPTSNQVLFTILIAIIAYFGFSGLTNVFIDFLELVGYKSTSSSIDVGSWWKYLIYIFTMAAVPAFCEEILFRGVIYQGLRKWSKTGAIFVSAALFMLMHGSPDQTVHQFVLGIVLAVVFNATGTIWCPMLLHFLNNFIALTLSFVLTSISGTTGTEEVANEVVVVSSYSPWVVLLIQLFSAIISAAIAGLLIWVIVKAIIKQKNTEITAKNKNLSLSIENANVKNEEDSIPTKQEKGKTITIVFFVLASIWVSFEWIERLISGILK